jgi:hypothetical protein
LLAALPALADLDNALLAEGWAEETFDDKAANRFEKLEDGALAVTSEDSVSVLRKPISVDLAKTPELAWRWRSTGRRPRPTFRSRARTTVRSPSTSPSPISRARPGCSKRSSARSSRPLLAGARPGAF